MLRKKISRKTARPVRAGEVVHSAMQDKKIIFYVEPEPNQTRRVTIPHDTLIEDGQGRCRLIVVSDPKKPGDKHFGIFDTVFRGTNRRHVWFFEITDHQFTVVELPK